MSGDGRLRSGARRMKPAQRHRRRRRRRHVHRSVLFDAATRRFPHRQGAVAARRRRRPASCKGLHALGGVDGIGSIVHGTTVGTNTLLERRGPRIGVITTRGFRDVLEMRRRDRRRTWGLWGDFMPIADRDMRLEVDERTLADGTIRAAVDRGREIRAAAKALRERGAEALAIIFINAYANSENERRALAAVQAVWPNEFVSASHQVLPEIREFERSSTAALNAYLQPVVGAYLGKLEQALGTVQISAATSHRAVERRHDVDGDGAAASGAHRAVGSGRRRDRRRGDRARRPASTTSSPATSAALRSTFR